VKKEKKKRERGEVFGQVQNVIWESSLKKKVIDTTEKELIGKDGTKESSLVKRPPLAQGWGG